MNFATLLTRVFQVKNEIVTDILEGRVPMTVTTWGDLHEHLDANDYVIEDIVWADENEPMTDENFALCNAISDACDKWLAAGGHRAAIAALAAAGHLPSIRLIS